LNLSGDGALHAASETGDETVVRALIIEGADVNKCNMYACACCCLRWCLWRI
jgi:hypothetical protein